MSLFKKAAARQEAQEKAQGRNGAAASSSASAAGALPRGVAASAVMGSGEDAYPFAHKPDPLTPAWVKEAKLEELQPFELWS